MHTRPDPLRYDRPRLVRCDQQRTAQRDQHQHDEEPKARHSALPPLDIAGHALHPAVLRLLVASQRLVHQALAAIRLTPFVQAHQEGNERMAGDQADHGRPEIGGAHGSGRLFVRKCLQTQDFPRHIRPQLLTRDHRSRRILSVPLAGTPLDLRTALGWNAAITAQPFADRWLLHLQGGGHRDLAAEGLDGLFDCFVHARSIGITCTCGKCIACYRRCLLEFSMLSGPELAAAFTEAMRLKKAKGVTQQHVAAAFGVRQASVSEWGKTGRIAKKHLNLLVEYFSDVVGAEHWGLHEAIQDALGRVKHPDSVPILSPVELDLIASFRQLPDQEQNELLHDVMARAESINQVVQRELKRLGHNVTGYISATKASKHLPAAPKAEPKPRGTLHQDAHSPEAAPAPSVRRSK